MARPLSPTRSSTSGRSSLSQGGPAPSGRSWWFSPIWRITCSGWRRRTRRCERSTVSCPLLTTRPIQSPFYVVHVCSDLAGGHRGRPWVLDHLPGEASSRGGSFRRGSDRPSLGRERRAAGSVIFFFFLNLYCCVF